MFTTRVVRVVFSLSSALWIGLSPAILSQAAEKQPEAIRWKFSSFLTKAHFLTPLFENYLAELSKASGGRVVIDMYHSAVLGTVAEHFDLIKEGIAQMGTVCAGYNPDRFQLSLFTTLPFSSDDAETATKINLELIKKNLINEEWKDLKLCCPSVTSPFEIQSNKKLSIAEDFKGLRIAPGGGVLAMIWDALGAKGMNIPLHGGEGYLALERGTIDATALNWSGASSLKFQEVTKYGY
ncbi:MAG: hypothetical protein ABIN58_06360, partial [candidate division WOR-3 bacterium]